MKIARILYPVEVLGPGKRVGIWMLGCKRACKGCANPELWDMNKGRDISVDYILEFFAGLASDKRFDGVTISGGEPFLQTKELAKLVKGLECFTSDILVFTGYDRSTLLKRKNLSTETRYILDTIAVLVDGKYIEERNEVHPLKGSENQKMYYRDEVTRVKYEAYIEAKRGRMEVQNFHSTDGIVAVGIHERDFNQQFKGKIYE